MRIQELREQRTNRVAEMRGLVDGAEKAQRDLSENERQRFDTLKGEAAGLEIRIGQAETLANLERQADAQHVGGVGGTGDLASLEARYSLGKALREFSETGRLTGAEGEFAAERRSGRANGFAAPVSLLLGQEHRFVGTQQPAAGPGGVMVSTSLGPLIDRPRPNLAVQTLGATVLSGLVGDLDLPRQKSSGQAYWIGEHQPTTGSDPAFDKISMDPKTVSGRYEISRKMLIQAPAMEQILRYDLGWMLAQQIDLAAAQGTGTGDAPRGIVATPGVKKVTQTYANSTPTLSEIDALVMAMTGLVESADIRGATGWLAHPRVRALLEAYRAGDGQGIELASILRGGPASWSTQIPAFNGPSTNLATLFYGNWPDLIVGYWSSVDIVLNTQAQYVADRGGAYIYAFLDCDVAVRHPESFTYTTTFPIGGGAVGGGGPQITANA